MERGFAAVFRSCLEDGLFSVKVSKSDPFGMGAAAANPDLRSSHFDCATVIVKARLRARDKLPTRVLLGPLDTHPDAAVCPSASHATLAFQPWSKSQGRS